MTIPWNALAVGGALILYCVVFAGLGGWWLIWMQKRKRRVWPFLLVIPYSLLCSSVLVITVVSILS
jgi:hypothetical protein